MRLSTSAETTPRPRRSILRSTRDRSKPTRRFFGRSQSTKVIPSVTSLQPSKSFSISQSKEIPDESTTPRRRSFLVRPPTPKGARKVLGVLNTSQKRSSPSTSSSASQQQSSSPSSLPVNDRERDWSDDEQQLINPPQLIVNPVNSLDDSELQEEQITNAIVPLISPIRSNSNLERDVPLGPSVRNNVPELLEVEASEISDEANSNLDPKSRSSRTSGSSALQSTKVNSKRPPKTKRNVGPSKSSPAVGIAFNTVGEEENDIPEAPTSYAKRNESWLAGMVEFDDRVRELQEEADILRKEKRLLERENKELRHRNQELDVLIGSVRMRASDSNAEIQDLNRQMKDTRKRMNRKIRDLEDELAQQKAKHTEDIALHMATERHLKAEIDNLLEPSSGILDKEIGIPVQPSVRDRARAIDSAVALQAQTTHVNRLKTSGSLSAIPRRKSGLDSSIPSVRSVPGMQRKNSTNSEISESESSAQTLARRCLIRRSFIAHIHSSKYGSTRNAWNEFLGGEAGTVSPGQFARAIRSLAIASDARDSDLEKLLCEICDVEPNDSVNITFPMFVRFYNRTKDESI